MTKLLEALRSGHVQVALATGASILAMAYASKHVLPEPIPYLELAVSPFLMTIYEAVVSKKKEAWCAQAPYWVVAILGATLVVIGVNLG